MGRNSDEAQEQMDRIERAGGMAFYKSLSREKRDEILFGKDETKDPLEQMSTKEILRQYFHGLHQDGIRNFNRRFPVEIFGPGAAARATGVPATSSTSHAGAVAGTAASTAAPSPGKAAEATPLPALSTLASADAATPALVRVDSAAPEIKPEVNRSSYEELIAKNVNALSHSLKCSVLKPAHSS